MPNAYNIYRNLTPKERNYITSHPHHILLIKDAKELAIKETRKYFLINGRNDKSDAFRHCLWSAILAKDIGYHNALVFTNAHESDPQNPKNEKKMDLHNNSVGLLIGRNGGNTNHLVGRCLVSLINQQLKVILP